MIILVSFSRRVRPNNRTSNQAGFTLTQLSFGTRSLLRVRTTCSLNRSAFSVSRFFMPDFLPFRLHIFVAHRCRARMHHTERIPSDLYSSLSSPFQQVLIVPLVLSSCRSFSAHQVSHTKAMLSCQVNVHGIQGRVQHCRFISHASHAKNMPCQTGQSALPCSLPGRCCVVPARKRTLQALFPPSLPNQSFTTLSHSSSDVPAIL